MNEKDKVNLKDIELKLIAELMRNSRRSDRELARALGVTQPTVSRQIKKLEKLGFIQEYTIVPNFSKLGFELLATTLVKLKKPLSSEEIEKAKELIKQTLKTMPIPVVMVERGIGIDSDGLIISYHENYSSLTKFHELLEQTGFLEVDEIKSFIVSLQDVVRFIPLTFSLIGDYMSRMGEMKG